MAGKRLTVGITARSDILDRTATIARIAAIVEGANAKVLLDNKRCNDRTLKKFKTFRRTRDVDVLLVIGGDGTIFRAVREMDTYDVPILSVNRGTLGFLAETALDEAETIIPKLLGGKGKIEKRSLLAVRAQRGKRILYSGYVLNEAVISQGAIARLIDLKTMVQGEHLTTFHADGVILATPTGSTAYSLAAGGPIVHPRLPCTIVTPINPHSFTQKPIVLPHDQSVHIEVMTKDNKFSDVRVSLTLDGQTYVTLKRGDVVSAALDGTTVKFLRRKEDTFYETLRNKLKWGEGL